MRNRTRLHMRGDVNLTELLAGVEKINGKQVTVGPKGDRNRDLAKIHEYGTVIRVTDRMRGYLASQGLHLKQSTTFIRIPERSFIRSGFDSNVNRILDEIESKVFDFLEDFDENAVLDYSGELVAKLIRFAARDLDSPALHPFTVERKGSSDPLIDSGEMVRSIDYDKN